MYTTSNLFAFCLSVSEPVSSSVTGSRMVTVPPIGPDELPPPYTPNAQGAIPMINCKVCQSLINIEGKTHQHVVKCSICNEATVSYKLEIDKLFRVLIGKKTMAVAIEALLKFAI